MLGLSIGIGAGRAASGLPTPLDIFGPSRLAIWLDPSDTATVWEDSAATTAASVDGPIGRIDDKSGNNRHAVQATSAWKPVYRQDGSIYYADFDGINDLLVSPIPAVQEISRFSVINATTWTANDQPFSQLNNYELRQVGVSPEFRIQGASGNTASVSTLPLGTTGIVSERITSGPPQLSLQLNNETPLTAAYTPGTPDSSLGIGARTNGTLEWNGRIYELVVVEGALTDQELASLKAYYADRHGVTL